MVTNRQDMSLEDRLNAGIDRIKRCDNIKQLYDASNHFSAIMKTAREKDNELWKEYISKYGKAYFAKKEELKGKILEVTNPYELP